METILCLAKNCVGMFLEDVFRTFPRYAGKQCRTKAEGLPRAIRGLI